MIEIGKILSICDTSNLKQEVKVMGTINMEKTKYIAVSFVKELFEGTTDYIDIYILKLDQDGELIGLENNEEFDRVSSAFKNIMK